MQNRNQPANASSAREAVIPLPNPGEGGAVFPGNGSANGGTGAATPVIPLPSPGEGGAVFPGNGGTGGTDGSTPVIPLPSPGEGGAVFPGTGSIILPILPRTSKVRFLNAAFGYQPFRILISRRSFVQLLSYGAASAYGWVVSGYQTVTVAGTDGYVYIQKTMPFPANAATTIAIVNTAGGLDLLQISDSCCPPTGNTATFRVSNLAYNSAPLDVLLADGRAVYTDVRFKETTAYKQIVPGAYQFLFAETDLTPMPANLGIETLDSAFLGMYPFPNMVASVYLDVVARNMYTVVLLQAGAESNMIQTLTLIDR